ncbi:MAG TPA: PEP-CTERM sorting domain-containing protein [Candidatus Limnocylindrales bacterium]|nr:PEP-CTERM sorting domain-containing protein [Candidatus Limnocylindrales bacterium]
MKRTLLITLGAAGAILLSMQVTQAQIYREVFGNLSTGSNSAPSSVGWAGNWGATASDASVGDNAPGTFNNFGVSTALGKPQNLDNINAGGPALSTANGLMFVSQAGQNFIAYTTGYTVNQTLTPIQDISFYAGSTATATTGGIPVFRIAVQQDGNWYASTQVLYNSANVSSAGNFSSATVGAQQVTFNWTTAASAWDNLTFTPGTTLALGGLSGGLNGDPITAFGLYSDATDSLGNTETGIRRFDTYQIDSSVVPEPGSVMLGLLGAGMLMGLRRARKA